jgi:hypothetical protein
MLTHGPHSERRQLADARAACQGPRQRAHYGGFPAPDGDPLLAHAPESLGPVGFEDLVTALAINALASMFRYLEAAATADAYTSQPIKEPVTESAGRWQGYTVVQTRHKRAQASTPSDNGAWLRMQQGQLDGRARRDDRVKVSDSLCFVTRRSDPPALGAGGHDWSDNKSWSPVCCPSAYGWPESPTQGSRHSAPPCTGANVGRTVLGRRSVHR